MLVLSRQHDESICLPGLGEIKVVEIREDKVRLGITLPEVIRVFRQEVWERVQAACEADPDLSERWRKHLEDWPRLLAELEANAVPRPHAPTPAS